MPQVYTKDEMDAAFTALRDLIHTAGSTHGVDIASIKAQIDAKFNELFTLLHENKNRIDLLDATIKKAQTNGVKSPYAR